MNFLEYLYNFLALDISTLITSKHFPNDLNIQNKAKLIDMIIQRYLDRHQPFCFNNCTDLYHGECDITNDPPFRLGICKCRPGWEGYDCSVKEQVKSKSGSIT